MNIETWKSQMRKGPAELAVLALLARRASSGVTLLKRMAACTSIGLSGGAIYPLLNRLEREGKIFGLWAAQSVGRAEKTYTLTPEGTHWLGLMKAERSKFEADLKSLLEGEL